MSDTQCLSSTSLLGVSKEASRADELPEKAEKEKESTQNVSITFKPAARTRI